MAWRRLGDKPLSEPRMESLVTHMCVTRPQWVNSDRPCRFASCSTLYLGSHLYFLKPDSSWKQQKNTRISDISTPLNVSLWWSHNIYLWRHNGARRHARAKHYEYFMLGNCTQITRVYWSKNPFELLYIYTWWNNLRLYRAIFFKSWIISKFRCLFYQSIPHCLRFYHCVSASPIN